MRPLLFGWGALRLYEDFTGRDALADLQKMEQDGFKKVTFMTDLLYCGLYNGAIASNVEPKFAPLTVANWMTEAMADNPDFVSDMFEAFAASMPQEGKKKVVKLKAG